MLILVSLPLLRSKTWPKQTMLWNLEESVQKMEYISDVCHKRPPSNGTSFQTCLPYCFRLQMNLWYGFYTCFQQTRDLFFHIYPSQRQNLLPILEISTQNFQNFHNFQNFGKKFQNLEFFSKISKTTKGPPLTSKRPPPPHYPITKFSIFSRVSKARGI